MVGHLQCPRGCLPWGLKHDKLPNLYRQNLHGHLFLGRHYIP